MKRTLKILAMTLAIAALPTLALAQATTTTESFGSASVEAGSTYTVEEMLVYAMQDEYMAEAEYAAIQAAFGVNNPFANIIKAEQTHQELLLEVFEAYGIPVPANTAAARVVIPATLQETYETGITAEINNIAMYQDFLAQSGLPQDVQDVFNDLIKASESHLAAFTRNAEKDGLGLGNGSEQGRNRKDDSEQFVTSQSTAAGQGFGQSQDSANAQGRGGRNRN